MPPWSKSDDKIVRTKPAKEAAKLTGRSLAAVYMRRQVLGIGQGNWSEAEILLIRMVPVRVAAKRLGRSVESVRAKRNRLRSEEPTSKK